MQYDLSVLIPARSEIFLKRTVDGVLRSRRGKTEIIVGLDGEWADPGISDHKDVTIFYVPESIGQRAMTNQLCRLSKAKYVMKLDGHCSLGEGFDTIMMEDIMDDWIMVPMMYNLHAFDWVCESGHRRYQGPSGKCEKCGKKTTRDVKWFAKPSPESTSMRFDKDLHFQYWSAYKAKQEGDLVETMSILGACWMLTRKNYWRLNICDEGHGSWGQQGTEVACKAWLSGGKLICNKRTWFAHLFRTQGGDFGFPYHNPGSAVAKARDYSRNLWIKNRWPLAKHDLAWLIKKFDPPDWNIHSKGIVYYTDNKLKVKIAKKVQRQLLRAELPIVSVSLKPMDHFGKNIHMPGERGYLQMFKQQLAGLEASDAEIIFFCEHDVLYHPSHFDFVPRKKDVFYYNTNVWKYNVDEGYGLWVDDCRQVSGLCGYRESLIKHYKERIAKVEAKGRYERNMGFEPGTHNRINWDNKFESEAWQSEHPNVDIRHSNNLTPNRWRKDQFRNQKHTKGWKEHKNIPYWNKIDI